MNYRNAIAALAICCAAPTLAEPMTMDGVIALNAIGLGDEAVIAKIKSSGTRFDLSTDQMILLKNQGVSGAVIAAMLGGGAPQALSLDHIDPMIPHATGVYVLPSAQAAKLVKIDSTTSNQTKTGGILGYALTGGIASMSIKAAIQNESARTKVAAGTPVFYFFFDESNPESARQSAAWLSGTAATVTSPAEFSLIKLMKKDGRREARVGSLNIGGAKTGVMDKDRLVFDYSLVRPGVFKATPKAPLDAGEYGFIYAVGAGGGGAGAAAARIFDFSVS